jgi:sigma-E factor negative regulatory protein RseA
MTDSVREQLSACLDDELARGELDLLLKRAGKEAELRSSLGRYAFIGDALRDKAPVAASKGFADRVMAAVETAALEPAPVRRTPLRELRWLRPVAGLAIAAGVATVAVISFQVPDVPAPTTLAANTPPSVVTPLEQQPVPSYTVPTTSRQGAFVPATRLTNYVVAHSEFSSPLGRRTVLSGVLSDDEEELEQQTDDADAVPADVDARETVQPGK